MTNLDGVKKSAILLITIGLDQATKVLQELSFSEIQDLIKCMLNLKKVPRTIVDQVISDFNSNFSTNDFSTVNTNYIIALSKKVLGDKDAKILLSEIKDKENIMYSIQQLNIMRPSNIANLIKREHPQIITTILVYLNPNQAAAILSCLEEKLSLDVILRISQFTGLKKSGENEFIKIINYILEENKKIISNKDGIATIIELLRSMTYDQEQKIISKIEKSNQKLANIIKLKMFVFEDIIHLDDLQIQRMIQETTLDELSIAIVTSSELLKEKILKNMSKDDSDYLRTYFIEKPSVSIDIIKEKQTNLLNIVTKFFK
ncbi:MAG: FliG C-terminal domain-containing protein [Buchnera aphidicola (Meitanaphis flavogallis)]